MLKKQFFTPFLYIISIAICLVPLAFNPFSLFAYEQPQVLMLRLILVVVGVFAVYHFLFRRTIIFPQTNKVLLIPLALFVLAVLISTETALSSSVAFWGSHLRFQGVLAMMTYFGLAAVVYFLIPKSKTILLFYVISISGTVCAAYGILQRFGLDPWTQPYRIHGTFGHPNYLAVFLAMTLPIAVYIFLEIKDRYYAAAALVLQVTAIFLTLTRSAWVAMVGSLCFILCALFWQSFKKHSYKLFLSALLLFVFTVGAGYGAAHVINANTDYQYAVVSSTALLPFVKEEAKDVQMTANPLDDRLKSIADTDSGSMAIRFSIWKDSWEIIKSYPIFGVGPDNMQIVYPMFYRDDPERPLIAQNTYADRAHNEFIDTWLAYGVIGLLALAALYLAAAALVGNHVFKKVSNPDYLLVVCIASGLLPFILANQLGFGVTGTYFLFWILFVLLLKSISAEKELTLKYVVPRKKVMFGAVSFFLVVLGIRYAVMPASAAVYAYTSHKTDVSGAVIEQHLLKAVRLDPAQYYYRYLLSQLYYTSALIEGDVGMKAKFFTLSEEYVKESRQLGLDRLRYYQQMVDIYQEWEEVDQTKTELKHKYEKKIWDNIPYFGRPDQLSTNNG